MEKFIYVVKDHSTNSTVKLVLAVYDDLEKAKTFANEYIEFLTKYQDPYDVDIFLENKFLKNKESEDGTYDVGYIYLKNKVVHLFIERYKVNHNLFED